MNRQISLAQYRSIDLTMLGIFMVVVQVVIGFAVTTWFPGELYVVSPVGIIVALVMMRWGPWAAVHAVLGGLAYVGISGGSPQQYLIYGCGNLLSMGALVLLRWPGKSQIRSNVVYTLLFGAAIQILMLLGRAGVAALLSVEPEICFAFITTDALSILFTLVGVWVIRRIDGLFEDQIQYLLRIQDEQTAKGGEQL